ncbi:MAG: EVE domain-containing protein [Chitinophagales bacterium]|nr:EVE domain-containing protein [Chitinophagales bacterium]
MNYWLMKTEPDTFSFFDLMKRTSEMWDGVRNYQARNFMKEMEVEDLCLIYHSGKERGIAGIGKIVKSAYQDPTDSTGKWICVDVAPVRKIEFLPLNIMKTKSGLEDLMLFRQGRLSVMPVSKKQFNIIVER